MLTADQLQNRYAEIFHTISSSMQLIVAIGDLKRNTPSRLKGWHALLNGVIAWCEKDYENALANCNAALLDDANLVFAYWYKAIALVKLERFEDALTVYDEILTRLGSATDSVLQEMVAKALINKGAALSRLDRVEDALAAFEEVLTCFGSATDSVLQEMVAKALINKGAALSRLDRVEDALAAFEEVLTCFGSATDSVLQEMVAKALINKGAALSRLDRVEDALAAFEEVLTCFGSATDSVMQEGVARALVNKGRALWKQNRIEDALAAFEEVLTRFGTATDSVMLQVQVTNALIHKTLILDKNGDFSTAIISIETAISRLREFSNTILKSTLTSAWSIKGYILAKHGDEQQSRIAFNEAKAINTDNQILKRFWARALEYFDDAVEHDKQEARRKAIEVDGQAKIEMYLSLVMETFGEVAENYFDEMDKQKTRTHDFLSEDSRLNPDNSLLFVLREWNSYTPAVPDESEEDRGGGYFIWHQGQGIVIDPGYDFVENFYRAGGRICNIHHIVITHAHNDHTADFERLLNLLYEYNRQREDEKKTKHLKQVRLYLSIGTERKFAGLYSLRDANYISEVTILNRGCRAYPQRIQLFEGCKLTVLRAYHDDVITRDDSVGLGFNFTCLEGVQRRLLFTGDTGLYPKMKEGKRSDVRPGLEIFNEYPPDFGGPSVEGKESLQPDLVVAHIGSIHDYEIKRKDLSALAEGTEGMATRLEYRLSDWQKDDSFYPNHLGLNGTLFLLDQLKPLAAIISEFGEELKTIKGELVERLALALNYLKDDAGESSIFIVPGDLSIVYEISKGEFLYHDTLNFAPHPPFDGDRSYWDCIEESSDVRPHSAPAKRPYLFSTHIRIERKQTHIRNYLMALTEQTLPYFLPLHNE